MKKITICFMVFLTLMLIVGVSYADLIVDPNLIPEPNIQKDDDSVIINSTSNDTSTTITEVNREPASQRISLNEIEPVMRPARLYEPEPFEISNYWPQLIIGGLVVISLVAISALAITSGKKEKNDDNKEE